MTVERIAHSSFNELVRLLAAAGLAIILTIGLSIVVGAMVPPRVVVEFEVGVFAVLLVLARWKIVPDLSTSWLAVSAGLSITIIGLFVALQDYVSKPVPGVWWLPIVVSMLIGAFFALVYIGWRSHDVPHTSGRRP